MDSNTSDVRAMTQDRGCYWSKYIIHLHLSIFTPPPLCSLMVILQFNVHLFIRLLIDVSSGVVRSRAIAPSALSLALGIIALKNQDVPDKTTDRLCNRVERGLERPKEGAGGGEVIKHTKHIKLEDTHTQRKNCF